MHSATPVSPQRLSLVWSRAFPEPLFPSFLPFPSFHLLWSVPTVMLNGFFQGVKKWTLMDGSRGRMEKRMNA